MKPKKTFSLFENLTVRFPPSALYLSDIQRLIQVGTERGLKVAISDSTDEFEDLEDLKENRGNRIKNLSLSFSEESPYKSVNVVIGEGGIALRSSKDDKLLPIWHEMKSVIEARVPFHARYMKPTLWVFVFLAVLAIVPRVGWPPSGSFGRILLLVVPAYLWATSFYYVKKSGGVYLQRQHEVESFWDKYGEKLLLLIGGAILGVIGNVITQKLLGK